MKAPDEIAGLVEWWDPDDLEGADLSSVSSWEGKNGLTLTVPESPDSSAATLLGGSRQPSGRQMVLMDELDGRLAVTDASLDNGEATVVVLWHPIRGGGTDWVFNKDNTNPATLAARRDAASDDQWQLFFRLDGSEGTARLTTTAGALIQAYPYVVATRYDGTEGVLRVNGDEVLSDAHAGSLDTDNSGPFVLGNHPTGDVGPEAMFGDVIVYSGAVSDADLAELEEWLQDRWNVADYFADWTTGDLTERATPEGANEAGVYAQVIRELDDDTWIMFAAIEETGGDGRWVDYWTAPKTDPHNWTRNAGSPIIDADSDSIPNCRGVAAVKDGSTWHLLVDSDSAQGLFHFSGSDLSNLTNHGSVFTGTGSDWQEFVRRPSIPTTKIDGKWAVYFDGRRGSATAGDGAIGVALTEDFSTFTDRQQVLDVSDLWWEPSDVGAPSVEYVDGRWVMLYAGFSEIQVRDWTPHYIGVATSSDGFSWTRNPRDVPVLVPANDGLRTDRVNAPHFFDDGTDQHIYVCNMRPSEGIASIQAGSDLLSIRPPSAGNRMGSGAIRRKGGARHAAARPGR